MKCLKKLLRASKRMADKVFGTFADEIYWRLRNDNWVEGYLRETSPGKLHPHRIFLAERISRYAPFQNLLEVGSASGPNLYLLAKKFPEATFYGTEINKKAVLRGNANFKTLKLNNVSLLHRKAEDLHDFQDKSIDIVLTDALLICIGPDKINRVLSEIFRVARKAIILNEWHAGEERERVTYNDHWIYNWNEILKEYVQKHKVTFTKIPKELWAGDWARYGYVIEILL